VTRRTFEHQADIGLELAAPDGPALFAEAGLALFETVCDLERVVERDVYELEGSAVSVEELLVGWLNDLVFLFEVDAVVCRRIVFLEWSRTSYRARLHGEPAEAERHRLHTLVKAATYHGLAVVEDEDGWRARVILDV
jgi:SHS2 domain-containing protein